MSTNAQEPKKPNRIAALFKEIGYFLSSRQLLKNLGILAAFLLLIFVLIFWLMLPNYTRHNESIEVPDIIKLSVKDAQKLVKNRKLRMVVTDSVYEPKKLSGVIIDQNPAPGKRVKPNRTIYLTVNTSSPPNVNLFYKQFIGRPYSFAERKLNSLDVKVKDVKHIPGKGENTVAEVRMGDRMIFKEADPTKGEKPPVDAQKIPRGSSVTLVLYRGEDAELKKVPSLVCNNYNEALFILRSSEYFIGSINADASVGQDTSLAYVYRQSPAAGSRASMGSGIKIWLTKEEPEACSEIEEELEEEDPSGF